MLLSEFSVQFYYTFELRTKFKISSFLREKTQKIFYENILYKEIIIVCSENIMENTNTFYGQFSVHFHVRAVHTVNTGLLNCSFVVKNLLYFGTWKILVVTNLLFIDHI